MTLDIPHPGLAKLEADILPDVQHVVGVGFDIAVQLLLTAALLGPEGLLLEGSGPVSGVIEVSSRVKSVAAFKNYRPPGGGGIEFVFNAESEQFVVGRPAAYVRRGGSPHQELARSIGATGPRVVGGIFGRSLSTGEILTNEYSGHFGRNWTPQIREQFKAFLERMTGLPVNHSEW